MFVDRVGKMLEYPFARVQRAITPPLRATLAQARKQLCNLYSSNPPHFLLDALEEVFDTSVLSKLLKHFLFDFPFQVIDGHSNPMFVQLSEIASCFLGCTSVAHRPPYLMVLWPRKQMKPWPLIVGGLPLYYATLDCPHPPTYS